MDFRDHWGRSWKKYICILKNLANNKIKVKRSWLLAHLVLDTLHLVSNFCVAYTYLFPKVITALTRSFTRHRPTGSITFATSEVPHFNPESSVACPDPEALAPTVKSGTLSLSNKNNKWKVRHHVSPHLESLVCSWVCIFISSGDGQLLLMLIRYSLDTRI